MNVKVIYCVAVCLLYLSSLCFICVFHKKSISQMFSFHAEAKRTNSMLSVKVMSQTFMLISQIKYQIPLTSHSSFVDLRIYHITFLVASKHLTNAEHLYCDINICKANYMVMNRRGAITRIE